ncbi:hypothetical protein N0V90_003967 [Kalmusia sp. IMI 367209]|nr:hypothetical protein N0V90_003967 [Kalmusia sp. IMI 367209]
MLGRLRMTTDEALRAYNSLSRDIFSGKNKKRKDQDGAFKATTLQEKVQDTVSERKLGEYILDPSSDLRKGKAFVCAMPAHNMDYPRLFRTYHVRANASANCRIWEAARATTAAPTFFKRIDIGEDGYAKEEFVDGALGCNNPAKQVLDEARVIFGNDRPVGCLVSIGTGHPGIIGLPKPDAFQKILPIDLVNVLKKIATDCESTAKELKQRFEALERFYFRFNVIHGAEGISLAEWDKIPELTTNTKAYMTDISGEIDKVVAVLCGILHTEAESKVCWSVPFARNLKFVGRKDLLSQIQNTLFAKDSLPNTAIIGLGGMGKTQIVLELAYRIRSKHPRCAIFWIPATDVETLEQAFANLGQELGLPGIDKDQNDAKKLIQRYLSQQSAGQWLLILDNVDNVDIWKSQLKDYLPRSQTGCIVCTTRNRKIAIEMPASTMYQVPEMNVETAMEMLGKLLPGQDISHGNQDAQNLLEQLAFIPLAIVQAAAYIKKNETPLSKYEAFLHEQEQQVIELLSEDFEDEGRYKGIESVKNPVATTWLMSFEQIRQSDPLAADYLAFISCVASKHIPESLLHPGPSSLKQENAIGTLSAYSFVIRRAADNTLDVHRLVQLVTRSWLKMKDEWQPWACKALERLVGLVPIKNFEEKQTWIAYLPHAIHVVGLTELGEKEGRLDLLDRIGRCERALGRYEAGEWAHRQLFEQRVQDFDEHHLATLASMNELGTDLERQGKYEEAESIHQRALKGKEKALGLENIETLISVSNLGSVLVYQGKYREAEAMHQRALEGKEKALGVEHIGTLISVGNLALALAGQGKYQEAEAIHQRALEGKEKALGVEHIETLISVSNLGSVVDNLGSVLVYQGKYREAEAMHRRALKGKEKVLRLEHIETLISVSNLGSVLVYQGKYQEAEAMYRRVLKGKEKVLGLEHIETLISVSNLGSVLVYQGKYQEAEAMHRRALEGKEKVLGLEHGETLTSVDNLASVLWYQGKYQEAENLQTQVLATSQRVLGGEHPDTLTSMHNLAFTLERQGCKAEAIELMDSCVRLEEKILGPDHPHTKLSLESLVEWRAEVSKTEP